MCGRTACTLGPGEVRKACCYLDPTSKVYKQPQWHDTGSVYQPSYNVCPTDVTPVLVAGCSVDSSDQRVILPMMWGMIPPWHKGDAKSHGLTTHNCRIEGMKDSKLYKVPLYAGNRCVIVCNGFYEWQTTKGKTNRQPYFIYAKQPEGVSILDDGKDGQWDEQSGWSGPNLLFLAGVYNTFTTQQGDIVYSYSMITMDTSKQFSELHHRMPAVLETQEDIQSWLDVKGVPADKALTMLKPVSSLCWHPVAKLVNSNRNKDPQCNKPLETSSSVKSIPANNPMMRWLQKGSNKPPSSSVKTESITVLKSEFDSVHKTETASISHGEKSESISVGVKTETNKSSKRPVENIADGKSEMLQSQQAEKKSKPNV